MTDPSVSAEPDEAAVTPEPSALGKPRRRGGLSLLVVAGMLAGAVLIAGAGAGFYEYGSSEVAAANASHAAEVKTKEAHDKAVAAAQAKQAAADAAAQAAEQAAEQLAQQKEAADESAAKQGFAPSPTADGLVFYKPVTVGQCPMYSMPCAGVEIAVSTTCTAGVYVAANLDDGSAVLGSGNAVTGALDPDHAAQVTIEFPNAPQDSNAKWDLTDAHCL